MIEIRCSCRSCEEVSAFGLDELVLVLPEEPTEPGPRIVHGCHHCGSTTARDLDEQLAGLLLSHGVTAVPHVGQPDAEPHPETPPDGPSFTADDVLAMHELLASDDFLAALVP